MNNGKKVPKRLAHIILNALQGGVVPRTGLAYIAVGREKEIETLVRDVEMLEMGGSTFRVISGEYGSGKTFLLQTYKEHVINKGFVVTDADLSPDRLLIGNSAQKKGLATYRELIKNISIKSAPEGGGLEIILDNWFQKEMLNEKAFETDGRQLQSINTENTLKVYDEIRKCVHGFDFVKVLSIYGTALKLGKAERKQQALKWLRGEFVTKTEARDYLGVTDIIKDDDWFDYIKIFTKFFTLIGHKGFVLLIDELVNIYNCSRVLTRQGNYEKMLAMYNDTLQGAVSNLGIIMGGTPKAINDAERGVFSYDALKSRLMSGKFRSAKTINYMTPIINIQPLTRSEVVVLLDKLAELHADIYEYEKNVSNKETVSFVNWVYQSNKQKYITPRTIIRDYIELLNVVYQNPGLSVKDVLKEFSISVDEGVVY